jgi:hypothetical protein
MWAIKLGYAIFGKIQVQVKKFCKKPQLGDCKQIGLVDKPGNSANAGFTLTLQSSLYCLACWW